MVAGLRLRCVRECLLDVESRRGRCSLISRPSASFDVSWLNQDTDNDEGDEGDEQQGEGSTASYRRVNGESRKGDNTPKGLLLKFTSKARRVASSQVLYSSTPMSHPTAKWSCHAVCLVTSLTDATTHGSGAG